MAFAEPSKAPEALFGNLLVSSETRFQQSSRPPIELRHELNPTSLP
jgi:hypothetical protein